MFHGRLVCGVRVGVAMALELFWSSLREVGDLLLLYVHPLKVNFLEPRPIQPILLTMEAAAKKFFSLPRFAVAGASQDPHKYGYQGHCFPIRGSMLIAYQHACSPRLVSGTFAAGTASHSISTHYHGVFDRIQHHSLAISPTTPYRNVPQHHYTAVSNAPDSSRSQRSRCARCMAATWKFR
jgi:hypothetical protein